MYGNIIYPELWMKFIWFRHQTPIIWAFLCLNSYGYDLLFLYKDHYMDDNSWGKIIVFKKNTFF